MKNKTVFESPLYLFYWRFICLPLKLYTIITNTQAIRYEFNQIFNKPPQRQTKLMFVGLVKQKSKTKHHLIIDKNTQNESLDVPINNFYALNPSTTSGYQCVPPTDLTALMGKTLILNVVKLSPNSI